MNPNQSLPAREVERMMKLHEVILKAMAKKIGWLPAAEIIGVTPRTMRRWRERLEQHGYDGLKDRRRGKPSQKRVPLAACEQVLGLYREKYFDFNAKHFHEKLQEAHGIEVGYTWVKPALQGAGLVARHKKRGPHREKAAAQGDLESCCTSTAASTAGFRMTVTTIWW
jgi:transposase